MVFHPCFLVVDSVRLVGGSSPLAGRVEIFYNNQWGTICDDYWDMNDASVVCRQLGFPQAIQAPTGARHGKGSGPILMDNVQCTGSESYIHNCRHRGWGKHSCGHHEDASVVCSSSIP